MRSMAAAGLEAGTVPLYRKVRVAATELFQVSGGLENRQSALVAMPFDRPDVRPSARNRAPVVPGESARCPLWTGALPGGR